MFAVRNQVFGAYGVPSALLPLHGVRGRAMLAEIGRANLFVSAMILAVSRKELTAMLLLAEFA